eukprot:11225428-Lingulodinium_polyedra.AAC.1
MDARALPKINTRRGIVCRRGRSARYVARWRVRGARAQSQPAARRVFFKARARGCMAHGVRE